MANYQTVGYYENGRMVELKPNARYRVADAASGKVLPMNELNRHLVDVAHRSVPQNEEADLGEIALLGRGSVPPLVDLGYDVA